MDYKITDKVKDLKPFIDNLTINDCLTLNRTELICLAAVLGYETVPGINSVENLNSNAVRKCLKELQKKKYYFPKFSSVGTVSDRIKTLIEIICGDGKKLQLTIPMKNGKRKSYFLVLDKDNSSVVAISYSNNNVVIWSCNATDNLQNYKVLGQIDVDKITKYKMKIDNDFNKDDIVNFINQDYENLVVSNVLYDFIIRKKNCAMFIEYDWHKNIFENTVTGILSNYDGQKIALQF